VSAPASHARLRALLSQTPPSALLPGTARQGFTLLAEPTPGQRFLPALPSHLTRAVDLAAHFMRLANARPGEAGLWAVAEDAERRMREGDPAWTRHALRLFLAHHPEGRAVSVPPLAERAPHLVRPSLRPFPSSRVPPGLPGAEVWMDYFREDAGLNEALESLGVRLPASGPPDPEAPERRVLPARRAERYWHWLQQLLARYDTERLSFGMHRVAPLDDLTAPINEGYDSGLEGFAPRPGGVSLTGLPGYDLPEHATRRDRLCAGASSGQLWHGDTPVLLETLEQLAHTLESTSGSMDGEAWTNPLGPHGAYHHLGEVLLACARAPRDTSALPGVMGDPATAARDPLFYRWLRHVDEILDTWRSVHLPPHDLSDAPEVGLRKWIGEGPYPAHQSPDFLLCFHKDMPGADAPDFDGQRWGEETFGGAHWDEPPPTFFVSTHTLRTRLAKHPVRLPDGSEHVTTRLEHEPFAYFLRMENPLPREQTVTVRIHLVADAFAEDRRMWIEMDRFVHTLQPSERAVLYRPSRLATVVREQGWPEHLLLPRGRREGMLFRFQVLITGAEVDQEAGYPFNRPLSGRRINALLERPNLVTRNIWIHHEG
jgi:tyrosinase